MAQIQLASMQEFYDLQDRLPQSAIEGGSLDSADLIFSYPDFLTDTVSAAQESAQLGEPAPSLEPLDLLEKINAQGEQVRIALNIVNSLFTAMSGFYSESLFQQAQIENLQFDLSNTTSRVADLEVFKSDVEANRQTLDLEINFSHDNRNEFLNILPSDWVVSESQAGVWAFGARVYNDRSTNRNFDLRLTVNGVMIEKQDTSGSDDDMLMLTSGGGMTLNAGDVVRVIAEQAYLSGIVFKGRFTAAKLF